MLFPGARWLERGGMLVASGVGLTCAVFAYQAVQGRPPDGMPAFPFFMFGSVGLLAAAGDVRVMLRGPLRGVSRLARHLWRMCFALFIAALSFFIGQADVFPESIRIMPLLGLPVLAVLVTMLYWLWRVRFRQSLRASPSWGLRTRFLHGRVKRAEARRARSAFPLFHGERV